MEKNKYILTPALLCELINEKQESAQLYQQLSEDSPDAQARAITEKLRDDEIRHYILLTELFTLLFRCKPKQMSVARSVYTSFESGLKYAISRELESFTDYRNFYLSNKNQNVKETLFELMTDEFSHCAWGNMLLYCIKK